MATNTTKLALSKPDGTDLVDVAVLNGNFDKIDAASGATICTSTTRPATPFNGQVIFETDTLNALVYRTSTTSWNILGGSTVASDPPAGAGNGNFWWDSDNGKLYIYYNDGNSGQWVSVMPAQTAVDVTRNAVINGGFDIWQRGTSISPASGYGYGPDRWRNFSYAASSSTMSRQTFTPGTAPVAGYEAEFFMRVVATNNRIYLAHPVEDVRTFAGQTVTLSFWAKSASAQTITVNLVQNFGTGGSSEVTTPTQNLSVTTGWQRFTATFSLPSISGKTVGANSYLELVFIGVVNNALDMWGVQLEAGSVATAFRRNANSLQGELAACQRYYQRFDGIGMVNNNTILPTGWGLSTAVVGFPVMLPVEMRIAPYSISYGGAIQISDGVSYPTTGVVTMPTAGKKAVFIQVSITSGVQFRAYYLYANGDQSAHIALNAEL